MMPIRGRESRRRSALEIIQRRLKVDDYVTPGQLVDLTGLSKNTVLRLLEELVARGEARCLDRHATKGHPLRYTTPERAA